MSIIIALLWLVNIICDTVGQISFKFAAVTAKKNKGFHYWQALFTSYWLWTGICVYIIGLVFWLAFLSYVPLSQGILLGSFNMISVMIAGRILFKEYLTPLRLSGIIFITIGVVLIGLI